MRGHENIIAMRMARKRPGGAVWVCDYPIWPTLLEWRFSDDCKNPTVCTYGDSLISLDFRFLVGLPVHITGDNVGRIKAMAGMCKRAEAAKVVASTGKHVAIWNQGGAAWQTF